MAGTIEELDVDACLRLLSEHEIGRIAYDDGRGPVVLPVNYTFLDGTVVFRTGLDRKLVSAEEHDDVAFEIDGVDLEEGTGWSVLVRGRLVEVTDPGELDRLRRDGPTPFAAGDREHYVRVASRSLSGRRVVRGDPGGTSL